jgi:hypothetical protein
MGCKGENEVSKIQLPSELTWEQTLKTRKRIGKKEKMAIIRDNCVALVATVAEVAAVR